MNLLTMYTLDLVCARNEEDPMGYRKRMIWLPVLLMVLVCLMPAVYASAETAEGMWLRTKTEDGAVIAAICVNATVTDGMIELTYNSELLTFAEVTVDSRYVAARAVNDKEAGLVKIAWVAPGDYGANGSVHILMQVRFAGTDFSAVAMTGVAHTPGGSALPVVELDPVGVLESLHSAAAYKSEDYTAESFAALETACANAEAILGDVYADQSALDAAAAAVKAAIDGLVSAPVVVPTEPTQPATKPTEPAPTNPVGSDPVDDEGDLTWVAILGGLVATGMAALAILRNKKKEVRK